jgi:hypothetical protein
MEPLRDPGPIGRGNAGQPAGAGAPANEQGVADQHQRRLQILIDGGEWGWLANPGLTVLDDSLDARGAPL